MRYDRNNDRFDLAYDEAVGNFTDEQREHMEREQAAMEGSDIVIVKGKVREGMMWGGRA